MRAPSGRGADELAAVPAAVAERIAATTLATLGPLLQVAVVLFELFTDVLRCRRDSRRVARREYLDSSG